MKTRRLSVFKRISILVFTLITILCLLFTGITYLSTTHYHQASTQLLNKDVAAHIAKFTSPFQNDGINREKADSVFQDAMVISPSAEVYFLDTAGKVIAFHAAKSDIRLWVLPLENIKKLIALRGEAYIKGPDPKDPYNPKIFSAAEVTGKKHNLGYIYVILGSNKSVTNVLYSSYFGSLIVKVICVIIVLSIFFSLTYLNRLQRSFNQMIGILERFQNGDFSARFLIKEQDEMAPVTQAFNKMADLLSYNITRLTKSEKERKDFIANISHDLRTPLAVARGFTETLLIKKNAAEITQTERDEFMQLVLRKIRQVEHMVKQLFELSKMESAEFVPHKERFMFSEILLESIHANTTTANEKNVQVDCTQCHDPSWINADIGMMERVIQNLLVNAINYTPANGKINITLQKEETELVLKIENSGTILSAQMLKWINLSEESSLTNDRPSNSGIGLIIIKKILLLHHFSFKATTSLLTGNLFMVRMPIINAAN